MTLYIFNPEHDLALANHDANYEAPLSARRFAADLACLPMWYAEAGAQVSAPENAAWKSEMDTLFPQLKNVTFTEKTFCENLCPWGWDLALMKRFVGINSAFVENVREHSHRRWSAVAMDFLRERVSFDVPCSAQELRSRAEVDDFIAKYENAILKAPLSGSGRGVWRCFGGLSQSADGWCARTLAKQGSVMAEPLYDKVCDFAMEFLLKNGRTTFAGYSVFDTEAMGVYSGSRLACDDDLEQFLTAKIPLAHLQEVKAALLQFFETYYTFYDGILGVDMLIFRVVDGTLCLNPMIEINLRMTMGMVARRFFDTFVHCAAHGVLRVERFDSAAALLADDRAMQQKHPLVIEDGRIHRGYFSLCPLTADTHYRIAVVVE